MDPARQSAVAGVILGAGVALLGAGVVAVAICGAAVNASRGLIVLVGVGIVFCGAAFGTVTFLRRLAMALAIPGVVLAFAVPVGWFALTPGARECPVQVIGFGAAAGSGPGTLDEASCLVAAVLLALGVAGGMAYAWQRLGGPRGEDGQ